MSDAVKVNFATQRNEDFGPFEARFTDADGQPTDMTSWSFELRIDKGLGQGAQFVVTGTPNAAGSYVKVEEGASGSLEIFIAKADVAALEGEPDEDGEFFFNLLSIEPDGTRRDFARGRFIAEPGVGMFDTDGGIFITGDGFYLGTEDGDLLRF